MSKQAKEVIEVLPCGPRVGDGEGDEYYEQDVVGGRLKLLATRWRNSSGQAVSMEWLTEGPRVNDRYRPALAGHPDNPMLFPPTFMKVVLKPGEETLVPRIYDQGVQQTVCQHPACIQTPLAVCVDETHEKTLVGGLGTRLERLSPQISPTPPHLSRSFDPAVPSVQPQSIDDRLLARARGVS
jgi:hypothetical protein